MSRKWRERREASTGTKGKDSSPAKPATAPEALRRRRNQRFLVVGLIGLSFPILELVAYQFRAITITLVNQSDLAIKKIKITYSDGIIEVPELKPRGSLSRVIRPNFVFPFQGNQFSTYSLGIRFAAENGEIYNQMGRVGALDYSAQEVYTITLTPPDGGSISSTPHDLAFPSAWSAN